MVASEERRPSRGLRIFMLSVDIGFLLYWPLNAFLPPEWLYEDYHDRTMVAWNWSFLPLDLFISFSGLAALWMARRGDSRWALLASASLAFTVASGANAIAFWALRGDFDLSWWIPNLILLLGPLPFLWQLLRPHESASHATVTTRQ